jgi:deoxyribodipyrimidine photo-lyase
MPITIFWFRRDLRLQDNAGLYQALKSNPSVQPIFIFDQEILSALKDTKDARVDFIYQTVKALKESLQRQASDLWVFYGKPKEVFQKLFSEHDISAVYTNHDYEPSAIERDQKIAELCHEKKISFHSFKDQVIFEKGEVVTEAQNPYTVYTPYKKKWLTQISPFYLKPYPTESYFTHLARSKKPSKLPSLAEIGFAESNVEFPENILHPETLKNYAKLRDFPAQAATSRLGLHLRFGTVRHCQHPRAGKPCGELKK